MKGYIKLLAAALAVAPVLGGCAADDPFGYKGEGSVRLSTNLSEKLTAARASSTEAELQESTIVWISNAKGPVRKFHGVAEASAAPIRLISDSYVAEAWAGDSVPASFTDRYFYGSTDFRVAAGAATEVTVPCRVANSVVAVDYAADVDDVLTDYTMTVGHSQGTLTYEGRDDRRGYFMMNSRDHDLTWTLTGRRTDGSEYTRTGVITGAARATLYTLRVSCAPQDETMGGGFLTVTVDESTVDIEDAIDIVAAPTIRGLGFDLSQPVRGEQGSVGRRSIWISANSAITKLILTSDAFAALGIGGNDFDLLNKDSKYDAVIEAAGINYTVKDDEATGAQGIKLNFEAVYTATLTQGDHTFLIEATDAEGRTSSATLTISVNDAEVITIEADPADAFATRATICGEMLKAGVTPALKYRPRGTADWTDAADVTVDGTRFSAIISGLTPGTVYEYAAATADGFISPAVMSVTTESLAQIPNGDFEGWSMSGSVQMLYADGAPMYWDSGNHGSTTAPSFLGGGNITVPVESPRHGGNYAIKMESKTIFSILAAGNAFMGKYLGTDGTNGILGWGRPFTSRPAKLRGWVKYTPGTVSSTSDKAPDIVKGQPDKGIIYVALLSGKTSTYEDGYAEFPVVVRTKSPGKYFSKDDPAVIAYGEKVFDSATDGDGLIEFEIPIDYRTLSAKPAYILLTMSASKGGDYFAGAAGSCMIVDDLELVYE